LKISFVDTLGLWIAAILTIGITSIAFKETLFSRWSERSYLATATAVSIAWFPTNLDRYILKRISPGGVWTPIGPTGGYIFVVFAVLVGLMAYGRYSRKYFWLYRYMLSLGVGTGVGVAMRGAIGANFIDQIKATFLNLLVPGDVYTSFNNIVMWVTVLSCLSYFIFTIKTIEHPTARMVSLLGRYLLMIAFGVSFGIANPTRINQYAGRIVFLLQEWLKLQA